MRLDHVSYAAEADGLTATAGRLAERLGVAPVDGGVHPRFGTRNVVLPMAGGQYVEVVEVLDHPASDKAPFGQAVRARTQAGGGWLGWVVAVDDITVTEQRLGRESATGNRRRPDGVELLWRQVGVLGTMADPQLPYFVQWESGAEHHPSTGDTSGVRISGMRIAGDPDRVSEWLGGPLEAAFADLDVEWLAPTGTPGVVGVRFATSNGDVQI